MGVGARPGLETHLYVWSHRAMTRVGWGGGGVRMDWVLMDWDFESQRPGYYKTDGQGPQSCRFVGLCVFSRSVVSGSLWPHGL